jgi:hypothetical protein
MILEGSTASCGVLKDSQGSGVREGVSSTGCFRRSSQGITSVRQTIVPLSGARGGRIVYSFACTAN